MTHDMKVTKKQLEDRLAYLESNPIKEFNGLNTFHTTEEAHIKDIKKCLKIVEDLGY